MPSRRRPAPSSTSAAANKRISAPRPSRLAKEHGASAALEAEIKEAYLLFAIADPDAAATATASSSSKSRAQAAANNNDKDVDGTVIPTGDVRRCLIALNARSGREEMVEILETLDPERVGIVRWEHFFAVAVMKVQSRGEEEDEEDGEAGEDVPVSTKGIGRQGRIEAEIEAAFALFTRDGGEQITLAHLKRVAKELREDVDDKMLRDMIREANGSGKDGVGKDEFGDVMRRAGVFG